jgi:hypothetical protein
MWLALASIDARSLAPLLRGEGWGEGLFDCNEVPPHPDAVCDPSDLSPLAGRGDSTAAT